SAAGEPHGFRNTTKVVVHDDHIRSIHGDVRTGPTHGEADVGRGQRRCVVDTVTHHGSPAGSLTELTHGIVLFLREQAGTDLVDAHLSRDALRRGFVVAGQHDGL